MKKEANMKIGILGSGDVGQALGKGFAALGNKVMIGSRTPESDKLQKWIKETGDNSSTATFKEAADFGEILVLATSWSGTQNAIKLAEENNFTDKVLIDATNPLVIKQGSLPDLALGHIDSGGEQVQRWLPKAKVVKCFNIVGNASMVNPKFEEGTPDMFICGNDAKAKETVKQICKNFGWPVIDIGGIDGSRLLEPLCILWVKYGAITNNWKHAFKMLKK
jgi:8-hydroxy-5-deazaflavin:NADPH oxidoreductase